VEVLLLVVVIVVVLLSMGGQGTAPVATPATVVKPPPVSQLKPKKIDVSPASTLLR
jgi:hypothetical protein